MLTRKSYSTPVYLIKNFEIGPVALELGHFKDGVQKKFFKKKVEKAGNFSSRKIIEKSYGKSKKSKFWKNWFFRFSKWKCSNIFIFRKYFLQMWILKIENFSFFISKKKLPKIFSCKYNFLNFQYFLKRLKILTSPSPLVSTKMRLYVGLSKSLAARIVFSRVVTFFSQNPPDAGLRAPAFSLESCLPVWIPYGLANHM